MPVLPLEDLTQLGSHSHPMIDAPATERGAEEEEREEQAKKEKERKEAVAKQAEEASKHSGLFAPTTRLGKCLLKCCVACSYFCSFFIV